MAAKIIKFDEEARRALERGASIVAAAVKITRPRAAMLSWTRSGARN